MIIVIGPPYTRTVQFMPDGLEDRQKPSAQRRLRLRKHSPQIRARQARKHQDRHHESHKCTSRGTYIHTEAAQIPRSSPESIADEEDADEDRDRESDKGGNSSNGEERAGREWAAEDKEGHEDAERSVKPDCVDGSLGVFVDALYPPRAGKAVIAGVGEGDSGSSNLNAVSVGGLLRRFKRHDSRTMQP